MVLLIEVSNDLRSKKILDEIIKINSRIKNADRYQTSINSPPHTMEM